MTRNNMPNILPMPCPFASGVDTPKITAIENEVGTSVNFREGFPSVYEAPTSSSGRFVTRGEMNAIGNLASNNDFHFRCGGINTFNSTLSDLIGGYPEGAILEKLDGLNLNKVISLVDNNTVDFNSVGVDGINWAYLNVPGTVISKKIIFEGSVPNAIGSTVLFGFKASADTSLVIDNKINTTVYATSQVTASVGDCGFCGYGCLILELDTASSSFSEPSINSATGTVDWKNWKRICGDYGAYRVYKSGTANYAIVEPAPSAFASIKIGKYYLISFHNMGYSLSNPVASTTYGQFYFDRRDINITGDLTIRYL